MALLFRIHVISKKLSSLCSLYAQTFDKKVALAPFACRQRNIFTNSCSIYFSKKKVDEVKTPKCPDFEQFFTKGKKGETNKNADVQLGKSISNEKGKAPSSQPPIFDDKTKIKLPPRPVLEKKASPMPSSQMSGVEDKPPLNVPNKNETKPQTSDDNVKQSDKPPTSEKKYSPAKPLDDFKQFALMPRSWDSKRPPPVESTSSTQPKETEPSQRLQTIEDSKTKEKGSEKSSGTSSEPNKPSTNGENNKITGKYLWLAAVAGTALLGSTLFFSKKKSNSDKPSVKIKEDEVVPVSVKKKEVKGSLQIPKKVPYLIIGGGAASWSAFKAIKEHVPKAKVLVVSNEKHPPYKRPPLSKDLWSSGANSPTNLNEIKQQIYFEPPDFYTDPMQLLNEENGGISILTNRTAKNLNLCERKVILTDGTEIEYEECLLAIGSKPRNLLVFQTAPLRVRSKISFFQSLNDFQSAKEILNESESIAVIGGGFLASEISFALTTYANSKKLNVKIYQIFHENANMDMTLPQCLSDWMTNKLTDYGLSIMPNTQVDSVHMENSKIKLGLLSGQLLVVDHVIVAMGSQPDFAFIQMSGLKLASRDCGLAVNRRLEALPHLYVAGDAACLPGHSGKETETSYDHAIASGRIAGENMTGQIVCPPKYVLVECGARNVIPNFRKFQIEVWGKVTHKSPLNEQVLNLWKSRDSRVQIHPDQSTPKPSNATTYQSIRSNETSNQVEIPDELCDAITHQIMTVPMTLPSGKTVDQSTIEKFNKIEATWGREPSDPFTGLTFTNNRKPIFNSALKSSIDILLTRYPNTLNIVPRTVGGTVRANGKRLADATTEMASSDSGKRQKYFEHSLNGIDISGPSKYLCRTTTEETNQISCYRCQSTEELYRIKICEKDFICRNCLLKIDFNECKGECRCRRLFSRTDVERLYSSRSAFNYSLS